MARRLRLGRGTEKDRTLIDPPAPKEPPEWPHPIPPDPPDARRRHQWPPERIATPAGSCLHGEVAIERRYVEYAESGQVTQRIVTGQEIVITLRGEGNHIAILEDALRQLRDNPDSFNFTVRASL